MPVPPTFGVVASGSAAPSGVTTLNPADKSVAITLSVGNLTATRNLFEASRWVSARATTSKSTGKPYFEATALSNSDASHAVVVGLALAAFNVDDGASQCVLGFDLAGASVGYDSGDGTIQVGRALLATAAPWISAGVVVQIASDLTAHLFWARVVGGLWNGDGAADPATGVGGLTIPSGSLIPAVSAFNTSPADSIRVNFGQSAFTGTVPAGFAAWG